jgi:tetratricopeptide (TPR) repeat protein
MSVPPPAVPLHPGPLRRWARAAAVPFTRFGRWFVHQPRAVQVTLVAVVLGGLAVGGYYATVYVQRRTVEREAAAGWRAFDEAARKTDLDGMKAALDRVLAAAPDDPLARRRRAALDAGSADPDDPDLALVLLNFHLQHNHLPEAAREAEKVLTKFPKHWTAHCALAHHALVVRKDPQAAEQYLTALPDPEDPAAMLDPGGLLYALALYQVVGHDPGPLRNLIVRRLLPLLRGAAAAGAPAATKVQLLECYLVPFTDPSPSLAELGSYWPVVARLADAALDEATAAGDAGTLIRLGLVGERLRVALAVLQKGGLVPDDRREPLAKELDGRTKRTWQAAREKDPTRFEPYLAQAETAWREGNAAETERVLIEGLAACGTNNPLVEFLIRVQVHSDNPTADPRVALRNARSAAEASPNDPRLWLLVALAAQASRDRLAALEACAKVRQLVPNHPHACALEAQLWLEAGYPDRALGSLRALGEAALRTEPVLAFLHAQALIGDGLDSLCEQELDAIARTPSDRYPVLVRVAAVLRGALVARPKVLDRTATVAGWVAAKAGALLAIWPADVPLRRIRADGLYRQAEFGTPLWNPEVVSDAIREYGLLPLTGRVDLVVAARLANLYLKGRNDPDAAFHVAAPLRAAEPDPALTPEQLEALGAVYVATGRPADALRVLVRAVNVRGATAGCWVQLALAYHANRQPAEARAVIDHVLNLERSPREHAEWAAAKRMIYQENP